MNLIITLNVKRYRKRPFSSPFNPQPSGGVPVSLVFVCGPPLHGQQSGWMGEDGGFNHTFSDYMSGVTFARSNRYFASSAALSSPVRLPPEPYDFDYDFEKELGARRAYEAHLKAKEEPPPPPSRSPVGSLASTSTSSTTTVPPATVPGGYPVLQPAVLVPSRPAPPTPSLHSVSSSSSLASTSGNTPATTTTTTVVPQSFEEFEAGTSVFDELEMKTIDDRSALNEIWGVKMATSSTTVSYSAAPAAAPPVPAPRTGTPASASSASSTVPCPPRPPVPAKPLLSRNGSLPNGTTVPSTVPQPPPTSSLPQGAPLPGVSPQRASLAAKLTAKGFRPHVVNLALASIKPDQMSYVEYYIKAAQNMEKLGTPADRGLGFLFGAGITDKKDILGYAETVCQLQGMGFAVDAAMDATRRAAGDRVRALDLCLQTPSD